MKQRPQVSPPPRRGGGRSLLPIIALISLALLALTVMPAIAQMPPTHSHYWIEANPSDPPAAWQPDLQASVGMIRFNWDATTSSNVPYVRCGATVTCQDIGLVQDKDYCVCPIGTCSLNYEGSEYQGTVVDWTDGEAEGEFGKYDAQSQWVPMGANCTAAEVTHYSVGLVPGVVTINCKVDDNPSAPLPPGGLSGPWADDDAAWSSKEIELTVYEFDITDTATDWVPKGGDEDNSTSYTARIRPTTDHNGGSMAKVITFTLSSSSEPGYCLNATDEDTVDLAFESQDGFSVNGGTQAVTTSAQTSAQVTLSCYDYGAYGTIGTTIPNPAGSGTIQARLRRDTTIYPNALGARVPYDYDGCSLATGLPESTNCIWDGWAGGLGATANASADEDTGTNGDDSQPGDCMTVYEEFRGLCLGDTHTRLSPSQPDLFVSTNEGLDVNTFPGALEITVHQLGPEDYCVPDDHFTAHVGCYTESYHDRELFGPIVTGLYEGSDPFIWGQCFGRVDSGYSACKIYLDTIALSADEGTPLYEAIVKHTVTHELGHAVLTCTVSDHHADGSGCVMGIDNLLTIFCEDCQDTWWLRTN